MRYVTGKEILIIHSEIIDQTGGAHGVRDTHLLASIIEKPKMQFGGKELYPGIFKKAAVYAEALVNYHVFIDGNKRTAIGIVARFLFLNNLILAATNQEIEEFAIQIAIKKQDLELITQWLKAHSRKSKK